MGRDLSHPVSVAAAAAALAGLAVAEAEPQRALELADEAERGQSELPEETRDRRVAGLIAQGRGLAYRALGRSRRATAELRRAVALLDEAHDRPGAGRARLSLAFDPIARGRTDEALALLERAGTALDGEEAAAVELQRALVLERGGRAGDSLGAFGAAIATFRSLALSELAAKALVNRGLVHAYSGNYRAATLDLEQARQLFLGAGDPLLASGALHNLGFVAARQGDLPRALRLFDEAQRESQQAGAARGVMLADRVQTLLDAGLVDEGRMVIERALSRLEDADELVDLGEAYLLAARAAELDHDPMAARGFAERAGELFASQGRARWRALAELEVLRADIAIERARVPPPGAAPGPAGSGGSGTVLPGTGHPPPPPAREELSRRAAALADQLRLGGWPAAALEAEARAVELAAESGALDLAADALVRLRRMRRGAPALGRLESWTAEATYRRASGDPRGALRALAAARRAFEGHRSTLGSLELRSRAGERAERAVELGFAIAMEQRRPVAALGWLEVARGGPAGAPAAEEAGAEVARAIGTLRHVASRLASEEMAPRQAQRLRGQQAALEEIVRRSGRHATRTGEGGRRLLDHRALSRAVGDRLLVEYGVVNGVLVAVGVRSRTWRAEPIGSAREAHKRVAALRLALRQWALGGETDRDAAEIETTARALEDFLLGALPLFNDPAPPDGLIVAPAGIVAGVPWGALPSLATTETLVIPSVAAWSLGRLRQVAEHPRVVVVAGPGLRHAASEARAIAATWGPLATVLEGERATTKAVLEAFANADIVHVAAHGTFRGDNPLVSSVRLTDGGLTGYELERAGASCTLVVLSSCDTGSADTAGDGSFGLAGLLIDSGVRSVVASVTPVGDERTSRLMGHFHELLRAGSSPAAALAGGRARSGAGRAADGFVVFGE